MTTAAAVGGCTQADEHLIVNYCDVLKYINNSSYSANLVLSGWFLQFTSNVRPCVLMIPTIQLPCKTVELVNQSYRVHIMLLVINRYSYILPTKKQFHETRCTPGLKSLHVVAVLLSEA